MSLENPKFFYRAAYLAAACWVGQMFIGTVDLGSLQSTAAVRPIMDSWLENVVLQGLWILMAVSLIFFGSACRTAFLAHPGTKSGYAAAIHAGWLLSASGLAVTAWANQSMLVAAESADQAGVGALAYLQVHGWFVTLTGLSTALIAMGLGARRTGLLPWWFAYTTAALGILGLLGGAAHPSGRLPVLRAPAAVACGRRSAAGPVIPRRRRTGRSQHGGPRLSTDDLKTSGAPFGAPLAVIPSRIPGRPPFRFTYQPADGRR